MSVGNFVPQIWAASILENLSEAHVYANVVNTDYEGDIKNFGDVVRINNIGRITVSSYTTDTVNLTPERLQGAGQTMTIDQAKYFYFAVDDVDRAQVKPKLMQEAMKEAAWAIGEATDDFLATLVTTGVPTANKLNGGSTVTRSADPTLGRNAYEVLVDLNTVLDQNKTPKGSRWVVIDPQFLGCLLKDARFSSFGQAANLTLTKQGPGTNELGGTTAQMAGIVSLGGGMLSKMLGMDVYVSLNVPLSGSDRLIVAGYKGTASFAEQIAEGQPEAFRLQTGFSDAVRGLHLYGGKLVRPQATAMVLAQYA